MKKGLLYVMILFLLLCLSGCSQKAIYSAEGLTIYRLETEEGKELYANMSIFPIQLSEDTKESLTAGEPVTEYTVTLSDGGSYGFQGMENEEPQIYGYTCGSPGDIADTLYMDILASDLAIYPESNHNFVLMYDSHARARTVSIHGAAPKLEKDYSISYMNIYICFGPATDRARYSLRGITDEADHVTYEIAEGEQAHLLYDMSKKKGAVFVRLDGAFYVWELEGIKELGHLYEFADSIHWVKSSH